MFLAVRLAVLVVLVTTLESGVPRIDRNVNSKTQMPQKNPHPKGAHAAVKSSTSNKSNKTPQLKEFPLDLILFKGRETNEANAFIKSNLHKGKALEQHYERAREQDMNEIEQQLSKLYQDNKQLITL